MAEEKENLSKWDGHLIQRIGWGLLGTLVTVCTLGICYPFAICWMEAWHCKHLVVDGKRLHFDGNGAQLIGKWICWVLLSIVTLTIFAWFIPMRIEAWKAKHTHFVA